MNSIRELYFDLMEQEGESLPTKLIFNWINKNDYTHYLERIKQSFLKDEDFILTQEDSWELYALSRVLDLLTLRFHKDNNADASEYLGPKIDLSDYLEISNRLNLTITNPKSFHPFHCEINEAVHGNEDFEILNCLTPTLKIGNLLLKRAMVDISLNSNKYDLDLVNTAKIYWAHRRKNRRFQDLSHGWGSNSQWRTGFRVDLETEKSYIYNVYGEFDLRNHSNELQVELKVQGLDINEAIELVRYRSFISVNKDDSDLFPYDFKYKENKTSI